MIPLVFFAIALAFALFEEFSSHGRSLVGWAVVALAIGLLWGRV